MKFVLIGYMGSGKTAVGTSLSKTLKYKFIDLDHEIERSHQLKISEIFKSKGEIYFRKLEATVLKEILKREGNSIIATGGGTPCYGSVMEDLLKSDDTTIIYLKNNLDTLTTRLFKEKDQRPLISHIDSEEILHDFIRKHLFERAYYYNRAHLIVNCEGLSPNEVVQKIVLKLF
ncbi:MAG: shikimate kinase [Flavobacteriaceae bacterium]|nr:shikimate kinase [Flavobacteriaceae bacterium]